MVTTTKGYPYPLPTDTPDVPRDLSALAAFLDTVVPFAFSAGTLAIAGLGAGASATAAVTFPAGRFTQPPIVTCSSDTNGNIIANPISVTTTGFTMRVNNPGAVASGAGSARWIAVQMLTTSGAG